MRWKPSVRNLGFTKQPEFIALYLDIFTSVKACDFNYRLFQHSTKKCCGVEPKDIIIFNSILPISIICYFIKVKKPLYNIWSALWVSFHETCINIAFTRPSPDPSVTAVYVAPVNRLFICCERMYLSWYGVVIIRRPLLARSFVHFVVI